VAAGFERRRPRQTQARPKGARALGECAVYSSALLLARSVAQALPHKAAQCGGRDENEERRAEHGGEKLFSPVFRRALAQEQRGQKAKEQVRDEERQRVGRHGSAPFKGCAEIAPPGQAEIKLRNDEKANDTK
jgi:hypothetical protein